MRYEALFLPAFVAGLIGAMSQQNVASPVRAFHSPAPAETAVSNAVVIPLATAALTPAPAAEPAPASVQPITAKDIAAEAKPVAPVKKVKLAKKQKPRQEIAAAPPPESVHHSFWYRLFHKAPDKQKETVATAEQK